MSVFAGPEISTNGLVFAYDMGNTNKSWKGAPTTNLATAEFFNGNANFTVNQNVTDTMPDGSIGTARELNAQTVVDANRTVSIGSYSLTAGSTYTLSFYVKNISCTGFNGNLYSPTLGGSIAGITYPTINSTGIWYRVTSTFTVPTGSGTPVTVSPQVFRDGGFGLFRMCWLQLEERSFATPYVQNTRSSTQTILDLTNISTVTVNGLNYTSNNYATINGTSSYIAITNSVNLRPSSELTIEYIIKGPNEASWRPILGYGNGDYGNGNYLVWTEGGSLNSLCRINNGGTVTEYRQYPGITISSTTYQQMTFTMRVGQSIRSYTNGVDTNTPTSLPAGGSFHYPGTTSPYQIGGLGSAWLVADVPFVRLYNRALTAAEIQQNFNALRGRFGI
jgi:hypothetical protein